MAPRFKALVPETDSNHPRRLHHIMGRIDSLGLGEDFFDGNAHQVRRLECHHLPPFLVGDRLHSGGAESRGEQPVITGWRTTTLQMAEHHRTGLFPRSLLDLKAQALSDTDDHAG